MFSWFISEKQNKLILSF